MSVLPSILWFFVIFQIVPQLLCEDTTIPPLETTSKSTEISANSSKSESTTGASSTTSSSAVPSAPSTPSTAETAKPTRLPIMHGAESVPSTPPPLLHNSGDAAAAAAATTTPKPTLKANTKSEKSAASFVNNPGVLTSLSVLLLICAIF